MSASRKMPTGIELGQTRATTMASPMMQRKHWLSEGSQTPHGLRTVMGFNLPTWQRGLVWTEAQKVSFIESAWLGVPLGTFTVNTCWESPFPHPLHDLLIDGQQRMSAIEDYVDGRFAVFGFYWSEVTDHDRRHWDMATAFPSYVTETTDEAYLRSYYDLMNFGGTSHDGERRASA